jgi:hypothetical protein
MASMDGIPRTPTCMASFVATGPGIKQGATIPAFENIHIYPLLAELLGLTIPADIDGRPGWLRRLVLE